MKYFSLTDVGKRRENNEDSFFSTVCTYEKADVGLFAVADGMGGYENGQYASQKAIEIVKKYMLDFFSNIDIDNIKDDDIKNASTTAIKIANKDIYDNVTNPTGTTFVMAVILNDKLFAINVGDSRTYIYNSGKLTQITKDNSYVQYLLETGAITEEQAKNHEEKNKITRAVGFEEDIEIDFYTRNLDENDKILLCSDGLTTMVDDEDIRVILSECNVVENVQKLVSMANDNGGRDNITVTVVEIN